MTANDALATGPRAYAWGFVAQAFASATNVGLSILAGQLLGSRGLGVVFIGFSAFQLVAGLQRAAVTQPLVAHAAPLEAPERHRLRYSGLTIVIATGAVATIVLIVVGGLIDGELGRGFLVFAPWILPGVLQEYWKAALFQEGAARCAALTDAIRLVILVLALPIALDHRSEYVIAMAWGLGAAAGFAVGTTKLRASLTRPQDALDWLRGEAGVLGRWLAAREIIYQLGTYSTVLILAVVVGSDGLGGLRAAESIFSPFSLIAAAFVLPALPALSRAVTESRAAAQRLAVMISGAAIGLGLGYFLVMIVGGSWLLTALFGSSFAKFDDLIWPFGIAQLLYAASFAFTVLLIAEGAGRRLLIVGVAGSGATVAFAAGLGSAYGVEGAAWGLTAASAVASVLVVLLGVRFERRGRRPASR